MTKTLIICKVALSDVDKHFQSTPVMENVWIKALGQEIYNGGLKSLQWISYNMDWR